MKILGKVAVGIVRESQKILGHIARSSLQQHRQHSCIFFSSLEEKLDWQEVSLLVNVL